MRGFLLDLWFDLREKRLTPIAILLVAGIIAVPLLLSKNEKEPTVQPTTTAAAAAPATPVVSSESENLDSKLQTFSSRDPFEPVGGTSSSSTTSTSTSGTTTSSGTSTGTSTSTTPSGGATTGTQPPTTTEPSTGNTGNTTTEKKTTLFTYTVDLRFGQGGDEKKYKNVVRLQLVPDQDNPKVVFLGVTATGKTGVFLIDSNIGVDTPGGKCKPSADQCTFLYLRPDSDHDTAILTDADGTVYHLRLLAIHRVTISSSTGKTTTGNSNTNTGSTRSPAFTGRANDSNTVPGGDTPPGEPDKRSSFQQFFADGADSGSSDPGK